METFIYVTGNLLRCEGGMGRTMRYGPLLRFGLLVALALVLGRIVLADPGLQTIAVPERQLSITLPESLEGWKAVPGTGNLILTAATRLSLATLEIVDTELPAEGDIRAFTAERLRTIRANGARGYLLWEEGPERYGPMTYHAAKWTALAPLGPLSVTYWSLDHYIVHNGSYLRMTLRYPDFMWRYFRPDRWMIGGSLELGVAEP